ncbi:hypothetical protein GQ44DRAFT_780094 [Phaeosphaeriaceae sp. PMI808]|nr:hypothetical protein GQ44DRAFT_780094 [Phaeosphaeriaceae sp. PMI808]
MDSNMEGTGGQRNPPPGGQQDPPPAGGEQQPNGQSGNWFQDLPPDGEKNPPPTDSDPDEPLPGTERSSSGSSSSPAPTAQDNNPDNDEYGPPLVSIPVLKTTEGDDTVGWIESGLRKLFINRYGSRRYGLYSIESDCVDRYAKLQDQNVMSEKNCKKPARTNYPLTYLYIRWKIEGKYHYAWETKSEMSLRYKGDNDSIIYQAACEQAARHQDVTAGIIRDSKSPSAGLADEAVRTQREQSLEADRASGISRSGSGTPSRRTPSPGRLDKQALRELMEEFQMMYLVDKEVDSIDELDTASKNSMFNTCGIIRPPSWRLD